MSNLCRGRGELSVSNFAGAGGRGASQSEGHTQ